MRFEENDDSKEDILQLWYTTIITYSRLHLTYESDRFSALAGLASQFAEILSTPYLAGLWQSDIGRGLLWACSGGHHTTPKVPSWSWASVELWEHKRGIISIGNQQSSEQNENGNRDRDPYKNDDRFYVVETTSSSSTFGKALEGSLLVGGAFISALFTEAISEDFYRFKKPHLHYQKQLLNVRGGCLSFDIGGYEKSEEVSYGDEISFLLVAATVFRDSAKKPEPRYCLALKRVHGSTYQRVGLLDLLPIQSRSERDRLIVQDWFANAPIRKVEII